MTVLNLKDYKLAKVFAKDLREVEKRIEASIKSLEPYSKYKPIATLIGQHRATKAVIEGHLAKYEKMIRSKGRVE